MWLELAAVRFVRTCICAYRIWPVAKLLSMVQTVHMLCCQCENRCSADEVMCCKFLIGFCWSYGTQWNRHSDCSFVHAVVCHKWTVMVAEQVRCASRKKVNHQTNWPFLHSLSAALTSLPDANDFRLPELVGVCAKFFITLDAEPGLEPPC